MPSPPPFPDHIGRYSVVRPLGQGGMGQVILAIDPILGRRVAIKVLRRDLGIPPEIRSMLLDRMRHEAQAGAALSHPNIVTIHDMGDSTELGLYLVFEYVEGQTLRERLQIAGELPSFAAAKIARELGSALTHAHDAGVIHRDIKPENILLSKTGSMITDFGIARLPDSTLTTAGAILGTPAYSAPEAISESKFGARSDQFSLAATLYEALSGKRAFPGDDAIAVAARVTNHPPPPLSSIMSPAPVWPIVDEIMSRAFAKNPSHRFGSCSEFGDALAKALDGIRSVPPPESIPMSILPRDKKRVHNYAAIVAMLVILALLLIDPAPAPLPGVSLREVARSFSQLIAAPPPRAKPPTVKPAPSARPASGILDAPSPDERADDGAQN